MEKEKMHKQTRKTNVETDKRAIKEKKTSCTRSTRFRQTRNAPISNFEKTEIFSGQKSIRSPIYYIREKVQQIN